MAYLGAPWFDGAWNTDVWEAGAWKPQADAIGQAWLHSVWATDTWAVTSWFPALSSETGGELPRVKLKLTPIDLTVTEVPEGGTSTGYTLPAVQFTFDVGSLLDLQKTLPAVTFEFSPQTLQTEITGVSIDAQTLSTIGLELTPVPLVVGATLPVASFTLSPQDFDTLGITLPAVRFTLRPRVSTDGLNLTTDPTGLKRKKLIKKAKGLFRKSQAIAAEDLINDMVEDVDAPDYAKEQ